MPLEMIHPQEAIWALRPLLTNTPHLEKTDKTPKTINSSREVRDYLNDFYSRITWFVCPNADCRKEWNALTHEGICIDCVDQRAANERNQQKLGEYLRKTIGQYGIENYSFKSFKRNQNNEEAYVLAKSFDHRKHNLFIHGPCGVGKTHLAGAILKNSCSKNLSVKWINPMYVTRAIKSKWPSDEEVFIENIVSQDVLIIDDLGVGSDLAGTLRLIYEVTDRRFSRKMNGLVINSNLSIDQISKAYKDDRIASRIAGMCQVVSIDGSDYRLGDSMKERAYQND